MYLVENVNLDYSVHILFIFICNLFLFDYAINAPRIRGIKRFCILMILAIMADIFIFTSYALLPDGMAYQISRAVYNVVTFALALADMYVLFGVINGMGTGKNIFDRLSDYIANGLSMFRAHEDALSPMVWQKGSKIISNRETQ